MLAQLKGLKLYGMAAAFDEILDEAVRRNRPALELIGRLLQAEGSDRHARSIRYQMHAAQFPMSRDIDSFEFGASPVNEQQVRALYEPFYVKTAGPVSMIVDNDGAPRSVHPCSKPYRN